MKNLTVAIRDDIYERVQRAAAARGASIADFVSELVEHSTAEVPPGAAGDRTALLAALDKGRNQAPVGPLNRDELYDREVLR
jgi:hypothetical protein